MTNNQYVSIVIPFYNAEETLIDAVRSVFAQTHKHWELILLDDGSTDRSVELARSISDPRVKVYSDGRNLKLASRLNQMVELASYDLIARMDADDLMTPDRIEKLLKILEDNSDCDLVSCGTYSIRNDNSLNGFRGHEVTNFCFEGMIKKSQSFLHAGLIARKSWYQRNQYDTQLPLGQDTELWLRALKNNDFKAISIQLPLYMYREEGNVTSRKLLTAYRLERTHYANYIDDVSYKTYYIGRSYFKSAAVKMMSVTNTLHYLLNRRNSHTMSDELIDKFEASLNCILNTKVPGVNYVK